MNNNRKLMITIDVEAQPGRAEKNPLDKLIWGQFPEGRFGLGEMMDIANEKDVKLVTFLDYCEEHLYGDSLLDVGREIHRQGHDLQLHAHVDFFSNDWWLKNGLSEKTFKLNEVDGNQSQKIFDFLCDAHVRTVGENPIAYRGGGYRFNQHTLDAAHKNGVLLHSSFNVARPKSYIGDFKRSKQFQWSNGCYEIPISTYQHDNKEKTVVEFNFNSSYFSTAKKMFEFLEGFYEQMGEGAIAVLVLHSWSFLELVDGKHFGSVGSKHMARFSEFLDLIQGKIEVIDSAQALNMITKKEVALDEPVAASGLVNTIFGPSPQSHNNRGDDKMTISETISKAEELWQEGSEQSFREAVRLLKQTFDQGAVEKTAYRLGTAYYGGKGVEKDLEIAYEYFCLTETRYAVYYRGLILSNPNFPGFDLKLAYKNFNEALQMGVQRAQENIDEIFKEASTFSKLKNCSSKKKIYKPTYCLVCSSLMETLIKVDKCPHCESASRTRTFPIIMDALGDRIPKNLSTSLPCLGFAMIEWEKEVLSKFFPKITSASLYGNYREGHIEGCDVRDLSRFSDNSFSGISSLLVFDYFPEIETALSECARVTAPGGLFITNINGYRLVEGEMPATVDYIIQKRSDYFDYVPGDAEMPSIKVGIQTFINAMEKAGYNAAHYKIQDDASGLYTDWFVGFLQESPSNRKKPPLKKQKYSPSYEKNYSTPLKGLTPLKGRSKAPYSMSIQLSVPALPVEARYTSFAEHVYDQKSKSSTGQVILLGKSLAVESKDNGQSWEQIPLLGSENRHLPNCFTTDEGNHIVQAQIENIRNRPTKETNPERATLFLFDQDWKLLSIDNTPKAIWHGRASIDQSGDTIMFAEYHHNNSSKYHPEYKKSDAGWHSLVETSKVFRSQDGGRTWEVVFEVSPEQIRHLHTLQADPFLPKTWWLSSGDRSNESRVWRTNDDGNSWVEVTEHNPRILVPDSIKDAKQSAFRYTDIIITPDSLIWGTDDIMGSSREYNPKLEQIKRTGSRIYSTPKSNPLKLEELGYIGHPVRSIIDIGPAYLFLTEANRGLFPLNPQVIALFKDDMTQPIEVARIDNFSIDKATRFSASRASKAVFNGRFFSYREPGDVFNNTPPRMLQWDIAFDD